MDDRTAGCWRIGAIVIMVVLLSGISFVAGFGSGVLLGPVLTGRSADRAVMAVAPSPAPIQVPPMPSDTSAPRPTRPPEASPSPTPAFRSAPEQSNSNGGNASFQQFWQILSLLQQDFYGKVPDDQHITYAAIKGLVDSLNDPFTAFLEPDAAKIVREDSSGSFSGIGATIKLNDDKKFEVVRTLPKQPAEAAGLQAGDIILEIDGKSTAGMSLYEAIQLVRGPQGTQVTLTIQRQGTAQPFKLPITRAQIQIELVTSRMLDNGIAYVSLSEFSTNANDQLVAALNQVLAQKPKGLILDLRDNPGGYLNQAIEIADQFLPAGPVMIERQTDGTSHTFTSTDAGVAQDIPLVVLVNGGSASASEIVAGAIQDRGRGKLIGEQTFGKGSVQQVHDFDDGSELRVTIAHWFTPNDRSISGQGLTPDIGVKLTPDDAKAGRDPQLDRAVAYLLNGQ